MLDSIGLAANPLIINITFLETAIVTGTFLLIGQAASNSAAHQTVLALSNTSSAVNAGFTSTIASVFQSWLTQTTSAYVSQLVTGQDTDAAAMLAGNAARLALFSDVVPPDVKVVNSSIDEDTTALLAGSNTAAVQSYAYNVTLQVTVLTATLLSSVFVSVLNGTAGMNDRRRLLGVPLTLATSKPYSMGTAAGSQPGHNLETAWSQQHGHSSSFDCLPHGQLLVQKAVLWQTSGDPRPCLG